MIEYISLIIYGLCNNEVFWTLNKVSDLMYMTVGCLIRKRKEKNAHNGANLIRTCSALCFFRS